MKKTALVKFNVLIEIDEAELDKEFSELDKLTNKISDYMDDLLEYGEESCLGCQSIQTIVLDEKTMNCEKCSECNTWVTDREKPNCIHELTNGAVNKDKLLCDDHLPEDHRWSF